MSRPLPIDLRNLSKLLKPSSDDERNFIDRTIDKISKNKSSNHLLLGTVCGWLTGMAVMKVGKIMAFGLGGGIILLHFANEFGYVDIHWERIKEAVTKSQDSVDKISGTNIKKIISSSIMELGMELVSMIRGEKQNVVMKSKKKLRECRESKIKTKKLSLAANKPATITIPPDDEPEKIPEVQKPPEPFKPDEIYPDKPSFTPVPKAVSHSPKISPSSIPNPSPSVSTKQLESFPNYGFNNLYSIPGYSAFQAYQGLHPARVETPKKSPEFVPFPPKLKPDEASSPKKPRLDDDENNKADRKTDSEGDVKFNEVKTEPMRHSFKALERKTPEVVERPDLRQDNHKPLEYRPCPAQFKQQNIKTEVQQLSENASPFKTLVNHDDQTKSDLFNPHFKLEPQNSLPKDFKIETLNHQAQQLFQSKPEPREKPSAVSPLRQYFKTDSISQQYKNDALASIKTESSQTFKTELPRIPYKPPEPLNFRGDHEQFKTDQLIQHNDTQALTESKMSITSINQGSGATVTIPTQTQDKKKTSERFSLKTSIPISKIDMKCVANPPDTFQSTQNKKPPDKPFPNTLNKKPPDSPVNKQLMPFHPAFHSKEPMRVEIQSNIVIKNAATKDVEINTETHTRQSPPVSSNSISTLINAAEAISNSDAQQWKTDKKPDLSPKDEKEQKFVPTTPNVARPVFSPLNTDTKITFTNQADAQTVSEPKNQILFIQNKNAANPKMFLTISQPQNPQVLLQRSNFESKNLQAPSRLSNLSKKIKEEVVQKPASKVVALKRLHQENCDENDFENLITENQIYGNKIVVKEKLQGTSQEQDLKKTNNMKFNEILNPKDSNVVIQPVYFSNVHFPPNLMMINNGKSQQLSEHLKIANKVQTTEGKRPDWSKIICNDHLMNKSKTVVSKEIQVLRTTNNNVLQTLTKQPKPDLVLQSNQKVIMNSQILYQVPMLVETDTQKLNTPFINQDYTKFLNHNKDMRTNEPQKTGEKLYIACPYQMDSKLQPKIVITNIRPTITKIDETSALDNYEKRRKLRRLKHLSNKEKDLKTDKKPDKIDLSRNIITPDKMKQEICKEFAKTKQPFDDHLSDTDSEYDDNDLKEYEEIIDKYKVGIEDEGPKKEFLAHFNLSTHEACKDKIMEKEERSLRLDPIAAAFISIDRIDRLPGQNQVFIPAQKRVEPVAKPNQVKVEPGVDDEVNEDDVAGKLAYMSHLRLGQTSVLYKNEYEKAWKEILNERRRRDGTFKEPFSRQFKSEKIIDTSGQLQILTEIKKSVNENYNLIKKRLDSEAGDDIHVLDEKNFTDLSKLSKMANCSVKLFSGSTKRDLNPGFDSENIQRPELAQPFQSINIPSISKIISLKTIQEPRISTSSQATSMDEPKNSAAGLRDDSVYDFTSPSLEDSKVEMELVLPWPGLETVMKSFRHFEAARTKELLDLRKRNTQLRVQCANATRASARESELARALLAERQSLAGDETSVRNAVNRLIDAVNVVRRF